MSARHAGLCLLVVSGSFRTAWAQDLTPLVDQCASGGSAELLTACQSAVLTAQSIRGGVAVADRMGASLSGSFSTLGRRLGSAPRLSGAVRFGVTRFRMPELLDGGTGVAAENSVYAYSLKGSFAVGVLDGFSLMSTVGGFLSLDLLGSASLVFLGDSDGFQGNEGIFSVGGRLGIFRESFNLPGLTVSAMQSFGGTVDWSAGTGGSQIQSGISATSVRAIIGKDFFTAAVSGGFGWNWDRGEMAVQVPDPTIPGGPGVPGGEGSGRTDSLTTRRAVYFAGVSITRLVYQFSVEGGWVGGYDGLAGYGGAYDPGASTLFISLAARVTY